MSFQSSVSGSSLSDQALPQQKEANVTSHPRRSSAANFRRQERNITSGVRPLCFTLTQKQLYERSAKAFRDYAGHGPDASAVLADVLECSKATAKNYLEGRNVPSGLLDLRALHAIPHYEAMKREIAALQSDIDPRLQAKLVEFAKIVAEHGHTLFEGSNG